MMARRDPKSGANRLVRAQTLQKQQRAPVGPRAPLPDEEDPKVRLALESFGYRGGGGGRCHTVLRDWVGFQRVMSPPPGLLFHPRWAWLGTSSPARQVPGETLGSNLPFHSESCVARLGCVVDIGFTIVPARTLSPSFESASVTWALGGNIVTEPSLHLRAPMPVSPLWNPHSVLNSQSVSMLTLDHCLWLQLIH